MKFRKYFEKHLIPQWKYYFLNPTIFEEILATLHQFHNKTAVVVMDELISSITPNELSLITGLMESYESSLLSQTRQVNQFFKFQFERGIKEKFFKVIINIEKVRKEDVRKKASRNKKIIKEAVERLLSELVQLKNYVKINMEGVNHYMEQYRLVLKDLHQKDHSFITLFNQLLYNCYLVQNCEKIEKIFISLKQIYLVEYYSFEKEIKGRKNVE